jgi:hypothetical protein
MRRETSRCVIVLALQSVHARAHCPWCPCTSASGAPRRPVPPRTHSARAALAPAPRWSPTVPPVDRPSARICVWPAPSLHPSLLLSKALKFLTTYKSHTAPLLVRARTVTASPSSAARHWSRHHRARRYTHSFDRLTTQAPPLGSPRAHTVACCPAFPITLPESDPQRPRHHGLAAAARQ